MGERPMADKERTELQECLDEAKRQRGALNLYIAEMEDALQRGTVWQSDPEVFRNMCSEVQEIARKDREETMRYEVTRYGHVLTRRERLGGMPLVHGESRTEADTQGERGVQR